MHVLLFDLFKHLLFKTCQKSKFLAKINVKKVTRFVEQKGIFGKTLILAYLSSAVFCLQNRVSDFF